MSFFCDFCKNTFSTKSILNFHQKSTRYCIELQKEKMSVENEKISESCISHISYLCTYCKKEFTTNSNLQGHLKKCKEKIIKEEAEKSNEKTSKKTRIKLESQKREYEEKLESQKREYEKQKRENEEKCMNKIDKIRREYEEKIEKQLERQQSVINAIHNSDEAFKYKDMLIITITE